MNHYIIDFNKYLLTLITFGGRQGSPLAASPPPRPPLKCDFWFDAVWSSSPAPKNKRLTYHNWCGGLVQYYDLVRIRTRRSLIWFFYIELGTTVLIFPTLFYLIIPAIAVWGNIYLSQGLTMQLVYLQLRYSQSHVLLDVFVCTAIREIQLVVYPLCMHLCYICHELLAWHKVWRVFLVSWLP